MMARFESDSTRDHGMLSNVCQPPHQAPRGEPNNTTITIHIPIERHDSYQSRGLVAPANRFFATTRGASVCANDCTIDAPQFFIDFDLAMKPIEHRL